jgi:hypothetical protein
MPDPQISCPHCGQSFPLNDALKVQIEGDLRAQYDSRLALREAEIRKQAAAEELAKFKNNSEQFQRQISLLQTQKTEQDKIIHAANARETELLKKQTQLDNEKRELELTVARTLAAERDSIYKSAKEKADEENRLKFEAERKRGDDAIKAAEDLKRKLEQGSQQAQGEMLEINLEQQLRAAFPLDTFSEVGKGVRGADLTQTIIGSNGEATILWEFKNTQAWSENWIAKLKTDLSEARADVAIIVTRAMPKTVKVFGEINGVWICSWDCTIGAAASLRHGLLAMLQARAAANGKGQKLDMMYDYITSTQFKQRVEAIADAFRAMQADLEQEKTAMARIWSKRQKHIESAAQGTVKMYGELQGILGKSLSDVTSLQLPGGTDD